MILLSTGPGAKSLRHFVQAFLTHEDANKRTKGLARVVSIDTKRRGYAHNILLPRVFA